MFKGLRAIDVEVNGVLFRVLFGRSRRHAWCVMQCCPTVILYERGKTLLLVGRFLRLATW